MNRNLSFSAQEIRVIQKFKTPAKIQDFLETIPINFETDGDTCLSPRRVIREHKAHCLEGALLAAACLWYHGRPPLLLDLKSNRRDVDHVVALFRDGKYWGAISKTNHAVLRYREPVYLTVRELALSYYHEYFLDDGKKTMVSYSTPLDMRRFAQQHWTTAEDDLWFIPPALDAARHFPLAPRIVLKSARRADSIEIEAGKLTEWQESKK
jgi:hypothetical protein